VLNETSILYQLQEAAAKRWTTKSPYNESQGSSPKKIVKYLRKLENALKMLFATKK